MGSTCADALRKSQLPSSHPVEAGWVLVGVAHGAMKSSCAPKCGCLIMQQACKADDVAPLLPSFQVDASVPRSCCMCVQGVTSDFSLSARPPRSQRPEIHMDKRCMHMQQAILQGDVELLQKLLAGQWEESSWRWNFYTVT